jgi:membrane protease YdiL (CAAX protease family)
MSTPRRWSLLVPVIGVLAAVALLPAAASPFVPVALRGPVSYLVVWAPLVMAVVLSVRLATRRRPEPWWAALGLRAGLEAALVGVFSGLALRVIGVLSELIVAGRIGTESPMPMPGSSASSSIVAVVLASAVIAPAVEETFFRGTLMPAVGERLGPGRRGDWLAIVIVALVFAAVHALAGTTPLATGITFLAGVGFGAVARPHGVGSAIIAHVVFNASGIAVVASAGGLSPLYPTLALG